MSVALFFIILKLKRGITLNTVTYQSLEFHKILNEVAAYAHTKRGSETILQLAPSYHRRQIESWLREVSEGVEMLTKSASIPIHSIEGVLEQLEQARKGQFIRAELLVAMHSFIDHVAKLKRYMNDKSFVAPTISTYVDSIEDLSQLDEELSRCLRHTAIDDYATKELARLRKAIADKRAVVKERASKIAKSPKYATYLQDQMVVEKGGHLAVPVKREYRSKVKGSIVDTSASGSTLFVEPKEVEALQEELSLLKMAEEREVEQILYYLTGLILEHERELSLAVEIMHQYDVIVAKAKYSMAIKGIPAAINEEYCIRIVEGRHPLLGESAVPLTVTLKDPDYALVITGPNTGGKTVTLKTVGLLTLMNQVGLHIPAQPGTELHLFQNVFVDIGDGQSITENLSTFSSRLRNIISVLEEANDHSLVLLDELGSGTDPSEGMGLATAILDKLYEKGAMLFATTHYNEMKEFAEQREGFINGSMEFDLHSLRPTYRLLIGETGNSQAFQIAIKLGMHPSIVEKAHEITYKEHGNYSVEEMTERMKKQVATNRYARSRLTSKPKPKQESAYQQGDNVTVKPSNEVGIIYKGPDENGDYIVQVKEEKRRYNHKRLKLHIKAEHLYPEDYDFDIIFKSTQYRKTKHDMNRKHVEGAKLEEDE